MHSNRQLKDLLFKNNEEQVFFLIYSNNYAITQLKELSFVTNLNFRIPISLQLKGVNLWFFKLSLFNLTESIVLNIKGLQHKVAKIKGLENMTLWQRLNSFSVLSQVMSNNIK